MGHNEKRQCMDPRNRQSAGHLANSPCFGSSMHLYLSYLGRILSLEYRWLLTGVWIDVFAACSDVDACGILLDEFDHLVDIGQREFINLQELLSRGERVIYAWN